MIVALIDVKLTVVGYADVDSNSWDQTDPVRLLLERSVADSESTNRVDVDDDGSHLDVSQVKRLRKFFHFPVFSEETTAVVVVSLTSTTF